MSGLIKICGFTDAPGLETALSLGADSIGFVFREDSPRFINFDAAARLMQPARGRARITAILSDANDDFLDALMRKATPDILQLHGSETPQRVAEISARYKKPVV